MVFGLFSRKRESLPQPLDESQPDAANAASSQLRTPSPSVDSASVGKQNSPCRGPPLTPSPPPEAPKPADLYTLIQSIPAPTLHSYTLTHLHPSNEIHPEALTHISAFFSELQPPPRLHCVRCHKSYFEVENTDRSCLIPHDDESAEVERVSAKAKGKGTLYETLWGCCGRTVEGDGDMGPPDGWCYEGKHTTDIKRARFRADSTPQDDKLMSCARLRCHEPPRSARGTRKRSRAVADDEDDEDEGEQSSTSSSMPSTSASPRSSNGKRRRTGKKARTNVPEPNPETSTGTPDPNEMDVDASPSACPAPSSPKTKPKSRAKPKPATPATAKSQSTPKTSSPLVLSEPFVSHSGSPEPPSRGRVAASMKPKASGAGTGTNTNSSSLKPKSSAASLRSKPKSAMEPPESPRRVRTDSTASSKVKAKPKGKSKGLVEVVDSSIDAERA
ncbi:hypothetical protein LshimejAT787_0111230 [Lyophyllum shimeji]|uniref:Uncharacterized protein n=1 Tax=Lyophyllum shimeji TaxID=47721 RepID=A0A9P3UHM2_LYOSH|nr:hypothetical protein LshimejAT787_0111230 [Lyophyllum shimeji]